MCESHKSRSLESGVKNARVQYLTFTRGSKACKHVHELCNADSYFDQKTSFFHLHLKYETNLIMLLARRAQLRKSSLDLLRGRRTLRDRVLQHLAIQSADERARVAVGANNMGN